MRWFSLDGHIHSVLSPCGELTMSPAAIVARAQEVGLDAIALTDHNTVRNGPALAEAAARAGLAVLFGLEVRSSEEVDVLCLFDDLEGALGFGRWVYAGLPAVECRPDLFGDQVVVDADEEILEFEPRLLIQGIGQDLQTVCETAREAGALVVPAHVDRATDSVTSQLGWLPEELPVDAVEMSRYGAEETLAEAWPWLRRVPVVRFSDAHRVEEIGYQQTRFHLAELTVRELRAALERRDGRWFEPVRRALSKEAN